MRALLVLWTTAWTAMAQSDADGIMARMAKNMENATEERRHWVYAQRVQARLLRTNGKMARREDREYLVTPGPERTEKQLVSVKGEYHHGKNEVIPYAEAGWKRDEGKMDIDGALMEDLVRGLVDKKGSRDGIPQALFPWRSRDLPAYRFHLLGEETAEGRALWRIAFEPKETKNCLAIDEDDDDDDCRTMWKGEAWVDKEDEMPRRIFSDMTFKMPWAVKLFLGTNISQSGFSVTYQRVAPGIWFPSTYGTEFRMSLLFGYKRIMTLAMDSREFRRGAAQTEVRFEEPAPTH
jgi:hypothetical protein